MIEQMLKALEQAIDRNVTILEGVDAGTYGQPTPCKDFDVQGLLNHVIGGTHYFAAIAAGKDVSAADGEGVDFIAGNPAGSYVAGKEAMLAVLNEDGTFDRTWKFPFGEMPAQGGLGIMLLETVVHGWDVAKATGQDPAIDDMTATMLLGGAKGTIKPEARNAEGNPFALEVSVPDTASATDKLVAFLGRTP